MSVEQLTPRRAPRPKDEHKLVKYDEYIETQIKNTRRAVKLVDLATLLVLFATGVLAFLLVAAVVEHWLVPGGFPVVVRSILFALLVGGVAHIVYHRLWPLVRKAINPVYAAQTIERSSPSLKNSLVNLLLFRQHRAEIPDAVYRTLEQQAAQRLSHVPVDAAVDRSLLIRVGYGLLAVVALAALYKVLSPKDPLVTAERLLMPWADIVPASRVSIRDVKPGSLTVSQGESVDVTAEVRGIGEDESVLLRYTTADGQAVDKPVDMTLSDDGLRFEARLPDGSDADHKSGLAQSVRYRIEAGDARSLEYALRVVPAPSLLVQRVEYDFPDYTGFVDRSVDGLGDIRAMEGTRVTVHARANDPISAAHVDFDADGRRDLAMKSEGENAFASFVLALREDRETPRHASYVLRFKNHEGRANRNPVKHPIVVDPDLQPETAILAPREKTLDVRLDETVTIDVEARDPDFALSEVRLHGESAGKKAIDHPMLVGTHKGRFASRYQFTPSEHDLKAGDVVQYWVTARDNRAPDANVAESERKLLRIVSPDPNQPPPDRMARNDRQQQRDGQQGQAQEQEGPAGQQGGQAQRGQQNGGQPQDGQPPQNGQPQQGVQSSGEEGTTEGGSPSADQGDRQRGNETGQQGETSQPREDRSNSNPENQNGEHADGNQSGQQAQQRDGSQGDQATSGKQNGEQNGEQTGAGSAGGDSQKGSQPSGARPDPNSASRSANDRAANADENSEPSPVSAEGDNDAEAFKRIQKHLERNGELKDGDASQRDAEELQGARQPIANGENRNENQSSGREAEPSANGQQRQADNKTRGQGDAKQQADDKSNTGDGESASAGGEQKGAGQSERQDEPGQIANERADGTGAETRPGDMPDEKQQQPSGGGDRERDSPGGQQTSSKGPSGAGDQEQTGGAPNSQPEMKPTEKRQQSGSANEESEEMEPSAGARGKRESDSQGEEGGDKAGGGEEGGGQKAPREGTGSAGQNQSADEGAGESSEKGTGNSSPNAGSDSTASERTGQPGGETKGRGTRRRGGQGEEPGGERGNGGSDDETESISREAQPSDEPEQGQGETEPARQGDDQSGAESGDESAQRNGQPGDQSGNQNEKMGSQQGGAPTGDGGQTGAVRSPSRSSQGEVPDGDAANLEYARKQTDLVLDKLADRLKEQEVDEQLLEDLGWTEEDMRRFLQRWQERKEAARRNDPAAEAAKRELDAALRSLGLRRGELRQNQLKDDTQRDLREGFRGPVPLKYQDRLRQYNQGVSRVRPEGGE